MTLTRTNGGGGGGGSLTVKDEGSTLSTAVTSIDVVGPRLTATNVGGAVTLTHADLAWITSHPDTPPTSPTLFSGVSYDKEFQSLTTGTIGGTTIGSPGTAPAIVDGLLKIVGGTSGSADLKGQEWTCPSGNFTMTAKLIRKAFASTFWVGGIFLRAGASGAGNIELGYSVVTGSNYTGSMSLGCGRYTALTTRTGISSEFGWPVLGVIYQRLVYNGTQVLMQASYTGHPGSFVTLVTDTLSTALGGSAPGRFGVGMDSFSASFAGEIYCQWIRFT